MNVYFYVLYCFWTRRVLLSDTAPLGTKGRPGVHIAHCCREMSATAKSSTELKFPVAALTKAIHKSIETE